MLKLDAPVEPSTIRAIANNPLTIDVAAFALKDGGVANVVAGHWQLDNKLVISGASTALAVSNDANVVDEQGKTIAAPLKAKSLELTNGGAATVKQTGTLDAVNIKVGTGSTVTITGDMSISGTYDASQNDAFDKYGIEITSGDAIVLKPGANLTLKGAGVKKALGVQKDTDSGKITSFMVNSDAFAAAGALQSEAGSTLNVAVFDKDAVLAKSALAALSAGLLGQNHGADLSGAISLGDVQLDALKPQDGQVKWSETKQLGVKYLSDTTHEQARWVPSTSLASKRTPSEDGFG